MLKDAVVDLKAYYKREMRDELMEALFGDTPYQEKVYAAGRNMTPSVLEKRMMVEVLNSGFKTV
jgi:hypothetical protein